MTLSFAAFLPLSSPVASEGRKVVKKKRNVPRDSEEIDDEELCCRPPCQETHSSKGERFASLSTQMLRLVSLSPVSVFSCIPFLLPLFLNDLKKSLIRIVLS